MQDNDLASLKSSQSMREFVSVFNLLIELGGNMAGKFVIEKAKDGQFYFNLKASNGQVILTSETYKAKSGAKNGIESIQKNAADDGNYERKEAKNGKPYFVLKAKNKQIIGQSQMYSSASSMEAGIDSVKNNAPDGKVEDLSS